jgi:hypothetical protein
VIVPVDHAKNHIIGHVISALYRTYSV